MLVPLALLLGAPVVALAPLAAGAAAFGAAVVALVGGLLSLALAPLVFLAGLMLVIRALGSQIMLNWLRQIAPGLVNLIGVLVHSAGIALRSLGDIGKAFADKNKATADMLGAVSDNDILKKALQPIPGGAAAGGAVESTIDQALAPMRAATGTLTTAASQLRGAGRNLQNKGADIDPSLPRP